MRYLLPGWRRAVIAFVRSLSSVPDSSRQPQLQPQLAASIVALIDASRRDVDVDVVSLVCPIWHVCPRRPHPSVCLSVVQSLLLLTN